MADTIEIVQGTATVVEVAGPTGPQGPAGAAGATGAQGPQGVPGTGLEVLTTQGDLLYQGASTGQRLPIGATGQVLKVAGGIPTWANESGAVSSVAGKTGVVTLDKNDVGLGNVTNTAQVTSVTGTAPIVSSGGTTPAISISAATTSAAGSMSSADKLKLDGIAAGAEVNVNADWNASSGDAQILNKPTIPSASSATPQALGVAAAGTSANFARADHVHAMPSAADVGLGDTDAPTFDSITLQGQDINAGNNERTAGTLTANSIALSAYVGSGPADNAAQIDLGGSILTAPALTNSPATFTFDGSLGGGNVEVQGHAAKHSPDRYARFTGQLAGMTSPVVLQANTIGPSGNLQFNFVNGETINDALVDLDATLISGDGTQVPDFGEGIQMSGGVDAGADQIYDQDLNTYSDVTFKTVDVADAATTRTNLGLGTAATADSTDFAQASHTHAASAITSGTIDIARIPTGTSSTQVALGNHTHELTALAATGATNGHVLTANGSGGVTFAAASGGGVTGAASSASDVLGVSGANITGVDANADRIIFWDDSASALKHLTVGSGLSLTDTTLTATGGGVTTGSVDNAVLRADGVGGSTSQSSDINILDATTSTQNNVAITNEHSGQTNSALVLGTKGTGAFIVSTARPDGTSTGGNARGASAICIQAGARSANTNVASGLESVAVGKNTKAANNYAIAIGSGTYATTTAVAIGFQAGNDGADSVAIGDRAYSNTRSTSVGQLASYANTTAEVVTLGYQTNSSVARGIVVGYDVTNTLRGAFATNAFRAAYWGGTTTDATANVVLNMDATATNRFTIAANTMVVADILIAANSTASGKASFWHYHVAIRRDGSNNTALVGSAEQIGTTQTVGSPSGWSVALTADDTNEALQLAVTGEASTSITWRATAFYRLV